MSSPEPTRPLPPRQPQPLPRQSRERPRPRRSRRVAGAVLALSVALVAGSYGLGRVLTPDEAATQGTAARGAAAADPDRAGDQVSRSGDRHSGPVSTVAISGGTASCQSADSVDAAGNPMDYAPRRAFDDDLSTAWRCDGAASGQRLTLELPARTRVAEVGLVPGYAKTDPASGVDRYAENNRVTRVRWTVGGSTYLQRIADDPTDRSMRTRRIPVTRADSVTLEILATAPGSRDTTPVSEVRVAAAG